MKRKAGIILVVLFLAALFIFLYKGYYKEIIGNSNADNKIESKNDSKNEDKSLKPVSTKLNISDESNFVNIGEEFQVSVITYDKNGKMSSSDKSLVECLGVTMSRINDTGIKPAWYKEEEKAKLLNENEFISDYYYLIVDVKITNIEYSESKDGIRNLALDSRIKVKSEGDVLQANEEARKRYYTGDNVDNIRGNMTLKQGESGQVRLVYVISDEIAASDIYLNIYNNGISYNEYKYIYLKKKNE